jgi:hypothetical protein
MTVDEWFQFIASGNPSKITVGKLPADLCRIIGSDSPFVRLRHDYALKLHRKHSFPVDELPLLPITIDLGRVISDEPRRLTFYFFERVLANRWYQATIKSTRDGTEMWLMTFHPQGQDEVTRMCRRCPILRTDDVIEANKREADD